MHFDDHFPKADSGFRTDNGFFKGDTDNGVSLLVLRQVDSHAERRYGPIFHSASWKLESQL